MNEHIKVEARLQILNQIEQEQYTTSIKAVGTDSFTIYEPRSGGKGLEMPQYSSWQFCLLGEDAVYFFTARVIGANRDGAEVYYIIKSPESVQRQQRRGHVRVPCHQNVLFWSWEEAASEGAASLVNVSRSSGIWEDPLWVRDYIRDLESKVPAKTAFTLDISGGGLRMVALDPLERHDRLLLKIDLDDKRKPQVVLMEAKVVRVVPLNIGGWKRFRVGVSFINLNEKVQEQLIAYLFRIMRKKL